MLPRSDVTLDPADDGPGPTTDGPGFAARTDTGLIRTGNEDRFLARSPVFAVADGMGGHLGGEVASQLAIDFIREVAEAGPAPDEPTLVDAIERSNAVIRREARERAGLFGMGTTCTVLVVDDRIRIAHVGDSRAYRFRDGRLAQLTEDHSLVAGMVREGVIGAEEAKTDGRRNIITRALGADDQVLIDRVDVDAVSGDRLLLCSDGLHGQVNDAVIADVLGAEPAPGQAADRLVELANAAGGDDNVTVIVIDVNGLADPGRTDPGSTDPSDASTEAIPTGRSRRHIWRVVAIVVVLLVVLAVVGGLVAVATTR